MSLIPHHIPLSLRFQLTCQCHLNSKIDDLLPWAYIRSDDIKAVA